MNFRLFQQPAKIRTCEFFAGELVFSVLMVIAATVGFCSSEDALVRVPSGLEVRLEAIQNEVLLGDPVAVRLKLKNSSKQPISLLRPQIRPPTQSTVMFNILFPGEHTFISIQSIGNAHQEYKSSSPPLLPIFTLAPGAKQSFDLVLDCGQREENPPGFLFSVAGQYKIKAVIFVLPQATKKDSVVTGAPLASFETEAVAFRVANPAAQADLDAYASLRKGSGYCYIYLSHSIRSSTPAQAIEGILEFQRQFPKSRYAEFVDALLISDAFAKGVSANNQVLMKQSLERAKQLAAK